ncbi:MAG: hypothetical protein ACOYD4_03320 [Solirubrobacterales bacterium]
MEIPRGKITYANVVATVALFIALGGAAYAATQPPKNSVGSRQLRKGAVRTSDIGDGAVTLSKIETAARLALQGAEGQRGSQGPAGTFGAVVTRWVQFEVAGNSLSSQIRASCQAGERAVGGGVGFMTSPGSTDRIFYSGPAGAEGEPAQGATAVAWEGALFNSEPSSRAARVFVLCAS